MAPVANAGSLIAIKVLSGAEPYKWKIMKTTVGHDLLIIGENNSFVLGLGGDVVNYITPFINLYRVVVAEDGSHTTTAITDEPQKKYVLNMFLQSDHQYFHPYTPIAMVLDDIKHYYCQVEEPHALDA